VQAHIVRIDQEHSHAWQVRLSTEVGTPARYDSKMFSDSLHGGKRRARKAAEQYLRDQLTAMGVTPPPLGRRHGMMFPEDPSRTLASNTSGRTGVYKSVLRRRTGNRTSEQYFWAAHYTVGPDGKPTHGAKRFYFGQVRDEEEAKRLATEFREGWEEAYLSGRTAATRRFFREWERG